jgi:hypothetical protein
MPPPEAAPQRITVRGRVILVYRPTAASRGTVVYVHGYVQPASKMRGYASSADRAWAANLLRAQFDASRAEATFVVIEAQKSGGEPVPWPDLGALLDAAGAPGPAAAVGHSGAYGTLLRWLGHERLRHVTLLDALYAGVDRFRAFARDPRRTTTLVAATATPTKLSRRLVDGIPTAERLATVRSLAAVPATLDAADLDARILFIRDSRHDHAGVVLSKEVIPVLVPRALRACETALP